MDDFNVSSLHESRNEWCAKLLTILTPLIIEGFKSIFIEAVKLCDNTQEQDKYLMTFQNFIKSIPKWNPSIIESERKRIIDKSGCHYLEDLVSCVHIIQLKVLTAMRVGTKQKKIDISIPKIDDFIHNVYIQTGRTIYKNVYLFQTNIEPLQKLKNNRELEILIQECILNTVRESIPIETILKVYMEETIEENVTEEVKEEIIHIPLLLEKPLINEPIEVTTSEVVAKSHGVTSIDNKNNIQLKITDELDDLNLIDIEMNCASTDENLKLLPDLLQDDFEYI
jgi:hypothetical protein